MPRSYVLLAHGVGTQESTKWWQPWKKAILDALRSYAPFGGMSDVDIEANHLSFVPISYDSVFDGYRDRWQGLAGALAEGEVTKQADLDQALRWIADQNNSLKGVFWSHVLDAMLWYGLPQARAAAQIKVAEQVVRAFKVHAQDKGAGVHLIAHSLGTSVLHDAIVGLVGVRRLDSGGLDPALMRFKSVSMIANTTRLLRAWKDIDRNLDIDRYRPYRSVMRPGPKTATALYLNFRHQVDPITWPKRFSPANWSTNEYSDIMLTRYLDPTKVHDFVHYFASPLVHIPVLRALTQNQGLGTEAEVKTAWQAYQKKFPFSSATPFSDLKALFADDSDKPLNTRELVEFLTRAYGVLS